MTGWGRSASCRTTRTEHSKGRKCAARPGKCVLERILHSHIALECNAMHAGPIRASPAHRPPGMDARRADPRQPFNYASAKLIDETTGTFAACDARATLSTPACSLSARPPTTASCAGWRVLHAQRAVPARALYAERCAVCCIYDGVRCAVR